MFAGHSPVKSQSSPLHSSEPNLNADASDNNIRKRKRGDDGDFLLLEDMVTEMKFMFTEFVTQQTQHNNKIDSLHSALEDIRSQNRTISAQNTEIRAQNDDIKDTVQFLSHKYDEAMIELKNLKTEYSNSKRTIQSLELKVDFLERNLKSATLEISNVPISNPETRISLSNTVCKIGDVIDQQVINTEIKNIYRAKSHKETWGTVHVEFSSTALKEQFLKSTKSYNKLNPANRLNTTHLEYLGPKKQICVSESLTAMTKRLHYLTREFIKSSSYEQCWIANGKVYVREKEGKPSHLIRTEDDLTKLRKTK